MRQLQVMERAVAEAPDHQVSLTDPDARAMATNGKGTGMVGYNVQTVGLSSKVNTVSPGTGG
jgi:hypothetical protein